MSKRANDAACKDWTVRRVYLDQNFWIDLVRAEDGRPCRPGMQDALDIVRHAAEKRLASFPLSSTHYLETYKRRNPESRQRLGSFMAELSRGDTIAHAGMLLGPELEHALHLRFGRPLRPQVPRVFGQGPGHAFGEAELDEITLDEDLLAALSPSRRHELRSAANELWRLASITGPPVELPDDDIQAPILVHSERWADAQNDLLATISREQPDGDKTFVQRVTAMQEYVSILQDYADVFERHGVAQEELFHEDANIEELNSFLRLMPVRWTVSEMRRLAFGDRQRRIEANDLEDQVSLAVASAHCDVVAGERYWTDIIRRSNADPHARVVSTPQDLVTALVEVTSLVR